MDGNLPLTLAKVQPMPFHLINQIRLLVVQATAKLPGIPTRTGLSRWPTGPGIRPEVRPKLGFKITTGRRHLAPDQIQSFAQ